MAISCAAQSTPPAALTLVVTDENGVAVADAAVTLTDLQSRSLVQVHTDTAGRAHIPALASQHRFDLRIEKSNFYPVDRSGIAVSGVDTLEITLPHVQEFKETVNVSATPAGIDAQKVANTETLGTPEIVNIPYPTSRDIRNLLPYFPQVVEDSFGQPHVAGSDTYQSTKVLDGFDINDPISGDLSMRFSADAVREMSVESSRISTEYGRSSGGLIDFETGMGDDRFRFDATNFLPSWQSKTHRGISFDKWVPRATVSGPIVKDKAWFFDSADAEYDNYIFKDLPLGNDRDPFWRGSNLAKMQINLRPSDILTLSLLNNLQDEANQGLSVATPQPATVNRRSTSYLASIKELHYFGGGALLDTGFAWNAFSDQYTPHGGAPYVLSPSTASGNYFETFHGDSRRAQAIANLSLKPINRHGHHELRLGAQADQINFGERFTDRPYSTLRADGKLLRTTTLPPSTSFTRDDVETGAYLEDRWSVHDRLLIAPGVRLDWNEIIRQPEWSPRIAGAYTFGRDQQTKLSAGIGIYYDRTFLDYFARLHTGPRFDTYYDPTGAASITPPLLTTYVAPPSSLHDGRYVNASVAIERKLPASIYAEVEYLDRRGRQGLTFQDLTPASTLSAQYMLTNSRDDRYHSLEFSARKHFHGDYNVFASFIHSSARSNEILDYTIEAPIYAPQQTGALPWDSPDRIVSWGWFPTPLRRLDFVYSFSYRTGFPWTAFNQYQQIVGAADSHRMPSFLTFDPGIELRFRFRGYALALRGVAENITAHANPAFVYNNVDAPNFGDYGGHLGRAFTARIRFLGRK